MIKERFPNLSTSVFVEAFRDARAEIAEDVTSFPLTSVVFVDQNILDFEIAVNKRRV